MFAGAEAEGYDAKIRARVPGYEAMHEIATAALVAAVPAGGHVLVVGAGGGEELIALATASPTWTFTALDPAPDMIALAQRRVASAGLSERVRFHTGFVADLPEPSRFDAATAILVSHFLPDDGARALFFGDIGRRVRAGGLLIVADLMAGLCERRAYRAWLHCAGLDEAMLARVEARMAKEFHPIGEARLARILVESGFERPSRLYQALPYGAYLSQRMQVGADAPLIAAQL